MESSNETNKINIERMLKPKDIKEILGCSMNRTYDIINCDDFPKIKIGHRSYISVSAFEKWVNNYTGKEFKVK